MEDETRGRLAANENETVTEDSEVEAHRLATNENETATDDSDDS